jgi:hypothetical protein
MNFEKIILSGFCASNKDVVPPEKGALLSPFEEGEILFPFEKGGLWGILWIL